MLCVSVWGRALPLPDSHPQCLDLQQTGGSSAPPQPWGPGIRGLGLSFTQVWSPGVFRLGPPGARILAGIGEGVANDSPELSFVSGTPLSIWHPKGVRYLFVSCFYSEQADRVG